VENEIKYKMHVKNNISYYNKDELRNMANYPGKRYALFTISLNGRSSNVIFSYSSDLDPELIVMEISYIGMPIPKSCIEEFMNSDNEYVGKILFKYIKESPCLCKCFGLEPNEK
jgi:hypothetical protein